MNLNVRHYMQKTKATLKENLNYLYTGNSRNLEVRGIRDKTSKRSKIKVYKSSEFSGLTDGL